MLSQSQRQASAVSSTFIKSRITCGHGYRVAKGFSFPNYSVARLESELGATNFLSAFQSYLSKTFPHLSISASHHNRFNIYNNIIILLPVSPHVSNTKCLNKIRAAPQTPSKNPRKPIKSAITDTVLVIKDQQKFLSDGVIQGV